MQSPQVDTLQQSVVGPIGGPVHTTVMPHPLLVPTATAQSVALAGVPAASNLAVCPVCGDACACCLDAAERRFKGTVTEMAPGLEHQQIHHVHSHTTPIESTAISMSNRPVYSGFQLRPQQEQPHPLQAVVGVPRAETPVLPPRKMALSPLAAHRDGTTTVATSGYAVSTVLPTTETSQTILGMLRGTSPDISSGAPSQTGAVVTIMTEQEHAKASESANKVGLLEENITESYDQSPPVATIVSETRVLSQQAAKQQPGEKRYFDGTEETPRSTSPASLRVILTNGPGLHYVASSTVASAVASTQRVSSPRVTVAGQYKVEPQSAIAVAVEDEGYNSQRSSHSSIKERSTPVHADPVDQHFASRVEIQTPTSVSESQAAKINVQSFGHDQQQGQLPVIAPAARAPVVEWNTAVAVGPVVAAQEVLVEAREQESGSSHSSAPQILHKRANPICCMFGSRAMTQTQTFATGAEGGIGQVSYSSSSAHLSSAQLRQVQTAVRVPEQQQVAVQPVTERAPVVLAANPLAGAQASVVIQQAVVVEERSAASYAAEGASAHSSSHNSGRGEVLPPVDIRCCGLSMRSKTQPTVPFAEEVSQMHEKQIDAGSSPRTSSRHSSPKLAGSIAVAGATVADSAHAAKEQQAMATLGQHQDLLAQPKECFSVHPHIIPNAELSLQPETPVVDQFVSQVTLTTALHAVRSDAIHAATPTSPIAASPPVVIAVESRDGQVARVEQMTTVSIQRAEDSLISQQPVARFTDGQLVTSATVIPSAVVSQGSPQPVVYGLISESVQPLETLTTVVKTVEAATASPTLPTPMPASGDVQQESRMVTHVGLTSVPETVSHGSGSLKISQDSEESCFSGRGIKVVTHYSPVATANTTTTATIFTDVGSETKLDLLPRSGAAVLSMRELSPISRAVHEQSSALPAPLTDHQKVIPVISGRTLAGDVIVGGVALVPDSGRGSGFPQVLSTVKELTKTDILVQPVTQFHPPETQEARPTTSEIAATTAVLTTAVTPGITEFTSKLAPSMADMATVATVGDITTISEPHSIPASSGMKSDLLVVAERTVAKDLVKNAVVERKVVRKIVESSPGTASPVEIHHVKNNEQWQTRVVATRLVSETRMDRGEVATRTHSPEPPATVSPLPQPQFAQKTATASVTTPSPPLGVLNSSRSPLQVAESKGVTTTAATTVGVAKRAVESVDETYVIHRCPTPVLPHKDVETKVMDPIFIRRAEGGRIHGRHHDHSHHKKEKHYMPETVPVIEQVGVEKSAVVSESIDKYTEGGSLRLQTEKKSRGVCCNSDKKPAGEVVMVQEPPRIKVKKHHHHHSKHAATGSAMTSMTTTVITQGQTRQITGDIIPQFSILPRTYVIEEQGIKKTVPTVIHDVPVAVSPVEVHHVTVPTEEIVVVNAETVSTIHEQEAEPKKKLCC